MVTLNDYFNKSTGQAISVKTLNTTTKSRIENPKQISSQLNGYINDMVGFQSTTKGALKVTNAMIEKKTLISK
ncbi:hypothetical protein [Xenorhabdus bakwenae]|uniref:endonuclease toxin domain-containing protein n=1 Tax=Xenorhabdus bakwenae TaxID=3026967 RepID=UPI003DA118BC